jgi:hypothetical protein
MLGQIAKTATGYFVRVEGGSQTGTYTECAEFLRYVGLTAEQQAAEAAFEGGGMGTGF